MGKATSGAPPKGANDAKGAPAGAMGAPGKEHDKLKPFVGTFRAEVRIWMGPGEPAVTTGTMTNAMDLGGRFLRQTYRGDATDGPLALFEGRGFWGYNTASHEWEGFWIDTASTQMQTETGDLDAAGRTWTMIGHVTSSETGAPMRKRSVITLDGPDRHSMEMFFGTPPAESRVMQITYVRAK
jgi:hypothetical protein